MPFEGKRHLDEKWSRFPWPILERSSPGAFLAGFPLPRHLSISRAAGPAIYSPYLRGYPSFPILPFLALLKEWDDWLKLLTRDCFCQQKFWIEGSPSGKHKCLKPSAFVHSFEWFLFCSQGKFPTIVGRLSDPWTREASNWRGGTHGDSTLSGCCSQGQSVP